MRPRLTLQTLTRGDGLLGLRAAPGFGPRGGQLTVARVAWTYALAGRPPWVLAVAAGDAQHPAPWPAPAARDPAAEGVALDTLLATRLRPLPAAAVQWRTPAAAAGFDDLWSLAEEAQFSDFWAEQVPRLQALGWQVVVLPGFAHLSVPVQRWRLLIDPGSGAEQGRELLEVFDKHGPHGRELSALRQPPRQGSWLLSLGVEIEGEVLDLTPMLATLLKQDRRWLKADEIAAIADDAVIVLRAPGGRRIDARAAPLKAIVGAMVDLLTDPRVREGPLRLSSWTPSALKPCGQR